jgi:methionine-rich copper-binding protein CopC
VTARRRVGVLAAGLLFAAAAVPAASLAAYAHDSLVSADPTAGATVTTLQQVSLSFSADPIDEDGADVVQVVGPDGRYYETGCPSLAGPVVTAPVALGPAGEYRVEWKIVSSDGHPVSDDYTFIYAPAADATAATGEASPVCGRESLPTDAAAPPVAAGGDAGDVWLGVGIAAVVVIGVGVGAWLLIRRPRVEE